MQNNSSFNKDIVRLAIPIVIQNIVTTAVGSADVIMLGFVGQDALAAGSLANQIMFILNLVYAGIASGVIMLAAQYWGKNDTKTIENIMGIAMQLSVAISSVFFILAFFFPGFLMHIFTNDTNLIVSGIPYLRVVSFSYLLMSFSQVYLCTMRSVERVNFSTAAYTAAFLLNIILNATFIFGIFRSGGDSKWGFFCDVIDMWGYAVPLGFISAFVLKLPPMWVYFLICTDEFVKIPFVYKHYKSYKWLKNITRDF